MLSTDTIAAFVSHADTRTVCDVLMEYSLLGTAVGDRVLACASNNPARLRAIRDMLTRRGAWDAAA